MEEWKRLRCAIWSSAKKCVTTDGKTAPGDGGVLHVPKGQMSQKSGPFEWIVAAVVVGTGVVACVQVLIYIGSNPVGLTVICLITAYLIVHWINEGLNQRR